MIAIAIFSTDPALRQNLEQLRGDPTIAVVTVADDPAVGVPLIDKHQVDAILVPTFADA
jgi:hypothetical protein